LNWTLGENKPKQSQFAGEAEPAQAIPKAFGFEAATRPRPAYCVKMKKRNLKKQTQFPNGQNERKYLYER